MPIKSDRYDALAYSTSLIFGTILSAADKMGIKPMLLGRQASKIIASIFGELSRQIQDKEPASNLEELIKDTENITKSFSSILNVGIEASFSDNCYTEKIIDCPYLEMAKFGKSWGYKACPLCGIMLIMMGSISALGFAEILDAKIENNKNTCVLKILIEQK
nr:hypothetical protein [Candidatus Freyarchaeota archaeon]